MRFQLDEYHRRELSQLAPVQGRQTCGVIYVMIMRNQRRMRKIIINGCSQFSAIVGGRKSRDEHKQEAGKVKGGSETNGVNLKVCSAASS